MISTYYWHLYFITGSYSFTKKHCIYIKLNVLGSLCHHFSDAVEVRNGCIRYSDAQRSWYDARNQCLITGGDLAVLEYYDRHTISDYLSPTDRWIGLRRTSWRWNLHQKGL